MAYILRKSLKLLRQFITPAFLCTNVKISNLVFQAKAPFKAYIILLRYVHMLVKQFHAVACVLKALNASLCYVYNMCKG